MLFDIGMTGIYFNGDDDDDCYDDKPITIIYIVFNILSSPRSLKIEMVKQMLSYLVPGICLEN